MGLVSWKQVGSGKIGLKSFKTAPSHFSIPAKLFHDGVGGPRILDQSEKSVCRNTV